MSSNYDSIPTDIRNAIDNFLNLDDNSKNAIGRLWRLYMEANNNSILIANQQLENFLNSLQQYVGQPQTMSQVINDEIVMLNLRIVHEDNDIFHGGFSLKRRKTGKKRKRYTMKTSRKKRKRRN